MTCHVTSFAVSDGHVSICEKNSCTCHSQTLQVSESPNISLLKYLNTSHLPPFPPSPSLPLSSLDPEQKEQLVEVIEKLLKDQTTVS